MEYLENIIEAILFLAGTSVSKNEIQEKLNVSPLEIEEAVSKIKQKFNDSGIILIEVENKIQFSTNQKYADEISLVLNPIREREFSQSMLEVASIIAYKQPITRLEVEKIRGVSSEYAISSLLKQEIIEVVGRKDAIGKPYLFGTTENFLKKFNLKHIEDLPNYEELVLKLAILDEAEDGDEEYFDDNEFEKPKFLDGEEVDIIT